MSVIPKLPIVERNLGREKAAGMCHFGEKIEIDPRLNNRDRLEVLIHELLHSVLPEKSEAWVDSAGKRFRTVLWADGYRRVHK